jgi:maltooligosyltrehalose trehalohydrolase
VLSEITPLGAFFVGEGQVRFVVWAPKCQRVDVELGARILPLQRVEGGYFSATHPAAAGDRYRFRLDGKDAFADPCSRYQPEGPHAPSEVVDPSRYVWRDTDWAGVPASDRVLYELHVGAFTREGTYAAAAERLPELKQLGVTMLELMPLNGFPGAFNWGYDGVNLFAPAAPYGRPDDLRAFVDRAHGLGIGVILDVVYNHLGPDGNYLHAYGDYFSKRHPGEWGEPLDFDSPGSGPVRDYVIGNACSWISEYHLDGLRLDATQNLYDDSPRHIISELCERVRAAAGRRPLFLVGESERQDIALFAMGLDALWVDDFHHVNRVISSGVSEAYVQDYEGSARELLACVLRNGIYEGQFYAWQKQARGTPLRKVPAAQIIFYLQNHDQLANSGDGRRMHQVAGEGLTRALTSLMLLAPQTPMLFMGQEHFADTPFHYFVDHEEPLRRQVELGRRDFLSQFPSLRAALFEEGVRFPTDRAAFEASNLGGAHRDEKALALHTELLALRKRLRGEVDGAVLTQTALCLRWENHLLLLELGPDESLIPPSEPLLAPPPGRTWQPLFSSELARFGGRGSFSMRGNGPWRLQGRCATVLEAT